MSGWTNVFTGLACKHQRQKSEMAWTGWEISRRCQDCGKHLPLRNGDKRHLREQR